MNLFRLSLNQLRRDWRAGEWRVLLLALVLVLENQRGRARIKFTDHACASKCTSLSRLPRLASAVFKS